MSCTVLPRYRVAEKFQQNGQTYFRSKAESLNFGDPQFAASTINGWIEKMTKGKITELIEVKKIKVLRLGLFSIII